VPGECVVRRSIRVAVHEPTPTVNLLSPWTLEAAVTQRLTQIFVAAAVVLLMLMGVAWGFLHTRTDRAEQELAVHRSQTARLTAHTRALSPVQTFVTAVDQHKVLARDAMRNEVYLSRVLSGIRDATPEGATVDTLGITVTPPETAKDGGTAAPTSGGASTATCPGPDPFKTRKLVGCVTLSGTARSRASVGDLVTSLGANRLFIEPFISTTTTAEGDELAFTGSVGLSTKALSRRYLRIDRLLSGVGR
jgi:Tfp pilus assembly protein PilN